MIGLDASTLIALASTLIALAAFGFSVTLYVKQRWERREASVSARLEQPDGGRQSARLVITNYGPRHADDVSAELQMRGGGEARGVVHIRHATEIEELPIPRLHMNESYYIRGFHLILGNEPAQVLLKWNDGRRRRQAKTVHLSVHPV